MRLNFRRLTRLGLAKLPDSNARYAVRSNGRGWSKRAFNTSSVQLMTELQGIRTFNPFVAFNVN
jgi:hypothetical protein